MCVFIGDSVENLRGIGEQSGRALKWLRNMDECTRRGRCYFCWRKTWGS